MLDELTVLFGEIIKKNLNIFLSKITGFAVVFLKIIFPFCSVFAVKTHQKKTSVRIQLFTINLVNFN